MITESDLGERVLVVAMFPVCHRDAVKVAAGLPSPGDESALERVPVPSLVRLAVVAQSIIDFVNVPVPTTYVSDNR